MSMLINSARVATYLLSLAWLPFSVENYPAHRITIQSDNIGEVELPNPPRPSSPKPPPSSPSPAPHPGPGPKPPQ